MSPFAIYRKTMIFSWLKAGIGLLCLVVCLAIGAIAWLVITKMAFDLMTSIAIGCGSFLVAVGLYYLIMSKLGYSIKMGHLAIIERADNGESVPSNPVEFSKNVVSERFGNNRQFYKFGRNVRIIQRELRRVLARGFSLESDTPTKSGGLGMQIICNPAMSCIDECCLAYALRCKDYEINAACVDGLTILVQSWPSFRRKSLKVSLIHIGLCLLTFAIFFVPGFLISRDLGVNTLAWFGAAFLLTLTVKIAFFDSYVLTKIVCEFLGVAKETTIEQKNYAKLDKWSNGYKKMREAAEKEAEKAEDKALKAEMKARKKESKAQAEEAPSEVKDSDQAPEVAADDLPAEALEESPKETDE